MKAEGAIGFEVVETINQFKMEKFINGLISQVSSRYNAYKAADLFREEMYFRIKYAYDKSFHMVKKGIPWLAHEKGKTFFVKRGKGFVFLRSKSKGGNSRTTGNM